MWRVAIGSAVGLVVVAAAVVFAERQIGPGVCDNGVGYYRSLASLR